jgi:hypothetical protein
MRGQSLEVRLFEQKAGGERADDGRQTDLRRCPRQHETDRHREREQHAARFEFTRAVKNMRHDEAPHEERGEEEADGLERDEADAGE